ncbi:hypothetical protein PybrP1_011377 [[Pythium] brassicae (nom. inval.)]|nr:hypothetical protein PybrP1_011377 [[Pythium] brassicae (nom. inval.)]
MSDDMEQQAPSRRLIVAQPADALAEYRGARNVVRYVLLRTALIALLVTASVALRDHFLDLADFIGASAHSTSCLILPLIFYLKVSWRKLPVWERVAALLIIAVCVCCGVYVSVETGKKLFRAAEVATPETPVFPFCAAEYQFLPYFVKQEH